MKRSDILLIGLLCCFALTFVPIPKGSAPIVPDQEQKPEPIVIYETDSGSVTAEKFFRLYAGYCAAAIDGIADKIESGQSDSMTLAEEWSALSRAAREEAGKGLDARVAALVASEATPKEKADWVRESKAGFLKVANGL